VLDKVEYWLGLCDDDIEAARVMLQAKKFLWTGFICHLITEKALKAVVASVTEAVPPKTHDLPKLAHIAGISGDLSPRQKSLLNKLVPLQIEARYPEHKEKIAKSLTKNYCIGLLEETEEFLCWIKNRLGK